MSDIEILLILSLILISSALIDKAARLLRLPAIVGYMLLGIVLKIALSQNASNHDNIYTTFKVMADLGIACLLFRVGLTCKLSKLVRQLKNATWIWIGDFSLSCMGGFVTAYYLLDLGLAASLRVATAFTATSLGVSVGVWEQQKKLDSDTGRLMIDVAEMDDISGVFMLGLVFAIIPLMHQAGATPLAPQIATRIAFFLASSIGFALLCYLFTRYK